MKGISSSETDGVVGIKGSTNMVRDIHSKAIVITDPSGLRQAKERKRILSHREDEIDNLKNDVLELKKGMGEIKSLLEKLIGKE